MLSAKITPSKRAFTTIVALAGFGQAAAFGQLIVDQSGARDVFTYSTQKSIAEGDQTNAPPYLRSFSLDGKNESATGSLGFKIAPNQVLSIGLTLTALDGYSQVLKKVPAIKGTLMYGWNSTHSKTDWEKENPTGTWFFNARASYDHEQYSIYNPASPAGSQLSSPTFDSGAAKLMGGYLFGGSFLNYTQFGLSASVGFERASNYQDLPQVDVSQSKGVVTLPSGASETVSSIATLARDGNLRHYDGIPLELDLPVTFTANWLATSPVTELFVSSGARFNIVASPYVRYEPTDETRPGHAYGLQVSFQELAGNTVKAMKLSYPLAVFVEYGNTPAGPSKWTYGLATVFGF